MPELPEVETVRRTLQKLIVGKKIRDIDVFYDRIIRNTTVDKFIDTLTNQTIQDIKRYGKHLLIEFDTIYLVSHLRMEGKYFIKNMDAPKQKHEHIIFYFTDGETLRYHDTRKFGTMDLIHKEDIYSNSPLTKLGYEPFEKEMTVPYLYNKLKTKTTAIKTALLDQTIMVGLGNIYVDETLFLSSLHPETSCSRCSKKDIEIIINSSKMVLEKAIKLGGTTIRSYTSSLGVTGRFQNELNVHMRQGENCPTCNTVIEKIKVNGRGTYYCPSCQTKK